MTKMRCAVVAVWAVTSIGFPPFASPVKAAPGDITVIAGDGYSGFIGDGGPATEAQFNGIQAVEVDRQGNIYIADSGNQRVRVINSSGIVNTFFEVGASIEDLIVDRDGNVFVAWGCCTITKVTPSGESTEITYDEGFINSVSEIAVDSQGAIYATHAGRVVKLGPSGEVTVIARWHQEGVEDDSTVIDTLLYANDLAIDSTGNLFIADNRGNRVYKIDSLGAVTVFAGTGIAGQTGDGGLATEARLNGVNSVTTDASDNVYIETGGKIRRVDQAGNICSVVTNYYFGFIGLSTDVQGNLYDSTLNGVQRIEKPECGILSKIRSDPEFEIFEALALSAGFGSRLDECSNLTSSFTVFAPTDGAFEAFLESIGESVSDIQQSPAIARALMNDHILNGVLNEADLEDESRTRIPPMRSGYQPEISKKPDNPAQSRDVGVNVFIDSAFIIDSFRGCNGYLYRIDQVLDSTSDDPEILDPPVETQPSVSIAWNQPMSPTSSKYVIFELTFSTPVSGLQNSSFSNIGTQTSCPLSTMNGTPNSEFSNKYFLVASCPGSGTVTPQLNLTQVTTQAGVANVVGSRIGPVIDIVAGKVLVVEKTGTGSGTVASTISAIDCGVLCTGVFNTGTTVTLKATPALGSYFLGWSGACRGTRDCTVRMTEVRNVIAQFQAAAALVVTPIGQGLGTVTGRSPRISCTSTSLQPCVSFHRDGTSIQLTARSSRGSRFVGWMGACSGTGTCRVNLRHPDAVHVFPIFEPR
jgi:sugar lactone lactonase YvrE/uncharacterized surface protein with fasciclin (FAS1) repeats